MRFSLGNKTAFDLSQFLFRYCVLQRMLMRYTVTVTTSCNSIWIPSTAVFVNMPFVPCLLHLYLTDVLLTNLWNSTRSHPSGIYRLSHIVCRTKQFSGTGLLFPAANKLACQSCGTVDVNRKLRVADKRVFFANVRGLLCARILMCT